MKTTLSQVLEKGFFGGLAKVSRNKDRKQMLQQIAGEALTAIDMSKGLQGRGDWMGAVAKLQDAAGILVQGVDLAETLPGVKMDQLRKQADTSLAQLKKAEAVVDVTPEESRPIVTGCQARLSNTAAAVLYFADSLRDSAVAKEGFSEELLLKNFNDFVGKMTITEREPGSDRERLNIMHRYGLTGGPKFGAQATGQWEQEPDKPGRQRRWMGDHYEYRDASEAAKPEAAAKSLVEDNSAKIEKPKEEDEKTETEKALAESFKDICKKASANWK